MAAEKGRMEQRQHHRVAATAIVTYRIMGSDEKENALDFPRYSETSIVQLPHLAKKFHSYHAVMKDISAGGLSVTGEQKFTEGDWVEVSMQPPKYASPVTMLAEVKWVKPISQMGKELYFAGIQILALDSDSMDRFSRFLLSEKIRMDNEKPK
ncbi:MAG TPA: PilZ domain-containing protein [bacterium]|nr:PilZ domain-containing protein [bacterium]